MKNHINSLIRIILLGCIIPIVLSTMVYLGFATNYTQVKLFTKEGFESRLALAAREGSIALVLRGHKDQQIVHSPGARIASLLHGADPLMTDGNHVKEEQPSKEPVRQQVEIIKGLQRQSVDFTHHRANQSDDR